MGCAGSKYIVSNLNINIHTTPAFSHELGGEIQIECETHITCDWKQNGNAALIELSNDRKHAKNVPPGVYEVICTSERGESITNKIELKQLNIPCVDKYIVEHASGDYARDGLVQVEIANINYSDVEYLWTTGVVTTEPILHDVRPGMYAVTLISKDKLPILFYHPISPAIVEVKKNLYVISS